MRAAYALAFIFFACADPPIPLVLGPQALRALYVGEGRVVDLRARRRDEGCALGGDLCRRFPESLAAPEHPEVGDNSFIATAESADEVGPLVALIDRSPVAAILDPRLYQHLALPLLREVFVRGRPPSAHLFFSNCSSYPYSAIATMSSLC
jgi:hypothetical protein